MALFRRHLRSFAIAWIFFQATSLSALVPRACCLAHQMAVLPDCHEQAAEQASMSAQSEAAPTMHHHHDHMQEQQPTPTPAHDCSLRGTCGGPAAALFALLSTDGVLTDSVTTTVDLPSTRSISASRDQLIPQFEPPDAPPPRA
jgi:hypothetical protein